MKNDAGEAAASPLSQDTLPRKCTGVCPGSKQIGDTAAVAAASGEAAAGGQNDHVSPLETGSLITKPSAPDWPIIAAVTSSVGRTFLRKSFGTA